VSSTLRVVTAMLVLGLHREMKELKRQSLIVFQIILQDQFYKTTFLFYFFAALGKNTQNKKDIGR